MSGGFTFGQPSSGFTFGTPKTTASAPTATGFGLTTSTPAATGGGFTFGSNAQTQSSTNPTAAFSFGAPGKSTTAGGGFSFGTPTTTFGLNAAPQTTAAASGFTLGGGLSAHTTATAPAAGGFTFGAASQAQTQPPATATAAPAATTAPSGLTFGGFSFGATKVQVTSAAASTTTTTTTSTGGGFSFSSGAPSSLAQPTSTTAAPTAQGGGFTFGIKPSSTPAPPASTQAAPSLGPSLFAQPITTAPVTAAGTAFTLGAAPASAASTSAATTTAAGGGLAFMLKPLGSATTTAAPASTATAAAATTGAATGFTLGLKPASSTSTTTAATATTTTTTSTAPPVMTYAQLEGLINKWSLELEDQERHFLQQATQVNAWDRMLVENGEKITSLHKEMEKVKLDQRRLNQELDFILSQQKELEDLLCPLEESVKEQSGTIYMQNADEERERTYKLAENVDAQLKRMSQDLKEIIEHLNTSSGPADTSDPLQQICKILNAHMDSLQWIDQNSVLLQRRVEEVSKLCDTQRKEQEKTFRLTFD
ncbi:nucleoporin 62 like isoform X2 [Archocentrus centrarchus]|uniref:nucleoporin 62 like isoform X2 n=1 Tax=Archocentrus centrarchus TaxID=63155 RepID=UPI0011E9D874|nr:nuclear pore glycoprotein p62 isoform X2 [Archocentrus centrarchus]